jgi:hypothetical protein
VQKVEGTAGYSLTAFSTYLSQIWNPHPTNGVEGKKLSQRIIKILVFWDVMLCHRMSDACFNRKLKTTNSVTNYHIPNGLNPQLQQCENLMTPNNIVTQPDFAEKCTI